MLFASFILIPICAVFALSLYDWNLLGDHRFVGLANFAEILGDREFWRALGNTLLYGIAIVPLVLAMGLGMRPGFESRPTWAWNLSRRHLFAECTVERGLCHHCRLDLQ